MARDLDDVETFIEAAGKHAADSEEPDHEVGDLQDMVRALWSLLAPAQHAKFSEGLAAQNAIEMAHPDGCTEDLASAETYISAAKKHGEDSEPDHEVGDLQDMLRELHEIASPEQREKFAQADGTANVLYHAYPNEFPERGAAPSP